MSHSFGATTRHAGRPLLCILAAIGFASTQDAIVKAMSGTYPVYETMIIRGLHRPCRSLAFWLAGSGRAAIAWPRRSGRRMLIRALILCSAYLAFMLAIAAMPIANLVAIYFTMPFFVAGSGRAVAGRAGAAATAGSPLLRDLSACIVMVRPGIAGV